MDFLLPAGLILLGVLVRCLFFGSVPVGFNQDEASAGYEAFALLTSGMDRVGNPWPVLLTAWGSGQNALYTYLSIPIVALLGLNVFSVRLLALIAGCASLPLFYLVTRRLGGAGLGLAALFLLAINPWHILISRWALESNLFPFFLLLGLWLLVKGWDEPRILPFAAFVFALSLYSYGTAFFFVPLFLLFCLPFFRRAGRLPAGVFWLSAAVFAVVAFPIAACNVINLFSLDSVRILGFTLPRLTQPRTVVTTIFSAGRPLSAAMDNFTAFLKLMVFQEDGLVFNSVPDFGTIYFFSLPVVLWGIFVSLRRGPFRRSAPGFLFLFALLVCILCGFLIDVNINRMNMIYIPLIYFCAVGLHDLVLQFRRFGLVPVAVYLVSFCLFISVYFTSYQKTMSQWFYQGLGEAVEYAETVDAKRVYITDAPEMPYIFVLFYEKVPPEEFIRMVKYENPGDAFQQVSSFGKYTFGRFPEDAEGVYIVHRSEVKKLPENCVTTQFGNYVVAVPQS